MPILRTVNRFVPTILAILAVLGLLLPPRQIVHAHDDGHAAHSHGVTQTVHVALPALPVHPHPHPHQPADPVDEVVEDVDSDEGKAPEPHLHLTSAHEAIARLRGSDPATDGSIAASIALVPALVPCPMHWPVRPEGVVPREGCHAPRPYSRSMDRLIVLGRLLI